MTERASPYLLASVAIILWGATPAATLIAVEGIDPVTVGLVRTITAALILFPLAMLLKLPAPTDRECWIDLVTSALTGFAGYTLIFTVGQKLTSTNHAALILASAPIFTGLIGSVMERKWLARSWWLGAAVALVGEAILITSQASGTRTASLTGDLLVLVSVVFVSTSYVTGGRSSSKIGNWPTIAWSISIAGAILAPVLTWRLATVHLARFNSVQSSWFAVLYLVLFTSIIGWAAWYGAIGRGGVGRIAPIQFAQPVVSLLIALAIIRETITAPVLLSIFVIFTGLIITKISMKKSEPSARTVGNIIANYRD